MYLPTLFPGMKCLQANNFPLLNVKMYPTPPPFWGVTYQLQENVAFCMGVFLRDPVLKVPVFSEESCVV